MSRRKRKTTVGELILLRRCGTCGANVRSHHDSFDVFTPARDERGRQIEEWVTDKETGQQKSVVKQVKHNARGLGHWVCVNGCKVVKVVTRLEERERIEPAPAEAAAQ